VNFFVQTRFPQLQKMRDAEPWYSRVCRMARQRRAEWASYTFINVAFLCGEIVFKSALVESWATLFCFLSLQLGAAALFLNASSQDPGFAPNYGFGLPAAAAPVRSPSPPPCDSSARTSVIASSESDRLLSTMADPESGGSLSDTVQPTEAVITIASSDAPTLSAALSVPITCEVFPQCSRHTMVM
jgi:hypothetical protein